MDIYKAISLRKSVRAFQAKDVPKEIVARLLEAARIAPSASNRQEWRFVVVRNAATRKRLSEVACGQTFIAEAPVVMACCAETDDHVMACGQLSYPIDLAIAIDHITLCAAAEGLGTCWIGAFDEQQVKAILNISSNVRVVGLTPLGYPSEKEFKPGKHLNRKPLREIVLYEKYKETT
ncbi:nitroreductase family protein [bacterium]|nr:nitroreductase family protein [bacterium]